MRRIAFILCCSFLFAAPALAAPDASPTPSPDAVTAPAAVSTPAPSATADAGPTDKKAEPAKKVEPKAPHEEPETIIDAIKDVGALVKAARNGNWIFFTGLLIMLLIFVLNKFVKLKERLPANAVPWVSAALGIVGSIAIQLTTGIPWGQALLQGLTAGVAAVGLWEMLFKHFLKKKAEPAPTS